MSAHQNSHKWGGHSIKGGELFGQPPADPEIHPRWGEAAWAPWERSANDEKDLDMVTGSCRAVKVADGDGKFQLMWKDGRPPV